MHGIYLNPRSAASRILCPGWSLCYGAKERAREFIPGRRRRRGKEETARGIFTHDEGRFANCQKIGKGYGILLEMSFSFFQKNIDGEGIWGTLGDALTAHLVATIL